MASTAFVPDGAGGDGAVSVSVDVADISQDCDGANCVASASVESVALTVALSFEDQKKKDSTKEYEIVLEKLTAKILELFYAYISQHDDGRNKSYSDLAGYQSAISKLYQDRGMLQPTENVLSTKKFLAGYRRTVADARMSGEMPLTEGKQPFTFEVYMSLCEMAAKDTVHFSVSMYCHLYLILCWNLMARSCSIGGLMYQHMSWSGDALVVTIPKHKGDQEGTACYPKHVYANPLIPAICPILALGVHVLTISYKCVEGTTAAARRNNQLQVNNVFCGKDLENKFSKWLQKCIEGMNIDMKVELGVFDEDLGTHSARKVRW